MLQLTQKEKMYLQDEKAQEELCVKKYNELSNRASDPELKQLFQQLATQEQSHLNTLNSLINGTIPQMQGQQQNQQQSQQQNQQVMDLTKQQTTYNEEDKYLCEDALGTEKHVSANYNIAIFEFKDKAIRNILNHIQKEEQEHGEKIFNYMFKKGMYQLQF